MPLLKGQSYRPTEHLPVGLKRNHEVWVIRTTGEVFIDYEMYLQKVRLYHEPVWSCRETARSGLTYLQAVMSEKANRSDACEPVVVEKGPSEKLQPSLQMTLTSAVMSQPLDMDLQLIGPYLRNEAKSALATMTPAEGLGGVLANDNGNQSDGKKRRSAGKDSDHSKSKSDAKKVPGTVKHTIYETLKCVGANGASISYLHQRLKDCKIPTTWADSSARNCIASLLSHDKAFVKLPKHGHYALASYAKDEETENEKRELPTNEGDAPEYARNNGRCMKCHKAKHAENSPLVFCDQCPSAIHAACAKEHETALTEIGQNVEEGGIAFPYLCYKCIQKRKMAERQKVVRQKREEEKLKKQEERNQRQIDGEDRRKENLDGRKRTYNNKPAAPRYPLEDLDLTDDDHRHKEEHIAGPLLPEPHEQPHILLDALSICEFLALFGTELDERLVSFDLSVAEFMYSLCWPFDSHIVKNTYQALLKTAVHQAMKLPDAPSEARQWNATLDGYTWPEILKLYLGYQQEHDLLRRIKEELGNSSEDGEMKLFLELSPKLHLTLLSTLVMYVSSTMLMRQSADSRLVEAKRLESEIGKMRKEMNKVKGKHNRSSHTTTDGANDDEAEKLSSENGFGSKRHLRRRGSTPENKETLVQNELDALEGRLERCRVRCEPLGFDRYRNEYYWFPSLPESLCIISPEQECIRCVRSKAEVDRILFGLTPRGVREKHLMDALKNEYDNLCLCFAEKEFSFDVENVPRGVPCVELEAFYKANKKHGRTPTDKLKQEHIALALKMTTNRLHKIVGGMMSVSADMHEDAKNIRLKLNGIDSLSTMIEFISELSIILKSVFQDGTEKQNGKTQMKLTAHMESLEAHPNMSLSEMGFYVATLREIVEPLVRAKSKAQHVAMEAKRKRDEVKSGSDKSPSSDEFDGPVKRAKQKHEASSGSTEQGTDTDALQYDAVPWRVTRSHARKALPVTNLDLCPDEESSSPETASDVSDSNKPGITDDDYEEADDSNDEQESTNEEGVCRVCGFGGRLIHCSGENCDVTIHRACMYSNKPSETHWYCSKCARMNRAVYRNDRHI